MLSSEELQLYKSEYNLAGQPDFLMEMHRHYSLEGKRVLEVGGSNLPKSLLFEVLRVRQWISVDRIYPQNRQYWPKQYKQTGAIPISEDIEYQELDQHVILDGGIERLPPSFAGRFDAIVSMDAFEHIPRFATMLERTYDALRPGGKMLSMYSVIWSSHFGHHLWGVTDKAGKTYYIESSPIPKWGHLLMRPHEMYVYLLNRTDADTADEIVYHVYHSEKLNRLFYEDYEAYFASSRFERVELKKFLPDVDPDIETQKRLEELYPGRKNFAAMGMLAICDKAVQAQTLTAAPLNRGSQAMSFDFIGTGCRRRTFKLLDAILFSEVPQPWERLTDGYGPEPPLPSMMCSHELKFLHYLARTQFDGRGAIVDLGPLVGSSTYALASGLDAGGHPGKIFSYDLWEFVSGWESFVGNAMLPNGGDLVPYFLANVDRFRDRIVARKGDLALQRWKGGPIQILFVDAAKSSRLMRHIANEFFPHLVPGALIVHQDWVSAEDPWIHVAMGALAGHFETMDSPEGGTVCFRLTQRILPEVLSAEFLQDPNALQYFADARAALPGWHGLCVWLAEAHYRLLTGDIPNARRIVAEVEGHRLYNPAQVGYDLMLVNRLIADSERILRPRVAHAFGTLLE